MPDMRASITDALAAQSVFLIGGRSGAVEFRLQALRRLRQVLRFLN